MKKLYYKNSAAHVYDALLLGNGRLGAAAYGGIREDVYNLNDDTLWSGYPLERQDRPNRMEGQQGGCLLRCGGRGGLISLTAKPAWDGEASAGANFSGNVWYGLYFFGEIWYNAFEGRC